MKTPQNFFANIMGQPKGIATLDENGRLVQRDGLGGNGKRTATVVVGTSTAGHTADEVDFLCDGVDDQEEINAAIAGLSEIGGAVLLREGNYNLTSYLDLNRKKVSLIGQEGRSTILKSTVAKNEYYIRVTSDMVSIKNINFDSLSSGAKAIYVSDVININVQSCTFQNCVTGISLNTSSNTSITNCELINCASGIEVDSRCFDCSVVNNTIKEESDFPIKIAGDKIRVTENKIAESTRNGISCTASNSVISNNSISNCTLTGIDVSGKENSIRGNTAIMCNKGIQISGSKHTINGNALIDNINYGISVESGNNSCISGNTCFGNKYGIRLYISWSCLISSNFCVGNSIAGIYQAASSYSHTIEANKTTAD